MSSKKLPYMPFYTGDWKKDTGVRALDLESRGLWFEMLCDMWECEERGRLLVNGHVPTDKVCSNFYGISLRKFKNIKKKLIFFGIVSIDEVSGCLFNRRMVRDEKIRATHAECGKNGGRPAIKKTNLVKVLVNQSGNQTLDNDIGIENKVLKKEKERIQKTSAMPPVPQADKKCRDRVEEFLVFAQKTHGQERKALLMLRGGQWIGKRSNRYLTGVLTRKP